MALNPIALTMLQALNVAYPEPVTIAPKDDADEAALNQLREADYVDQYDMWPNGDRRWLLTPAGRAALPNGHLGGGE